MNIEFCKPEIWNFNWEYDPVYVTNVKHIMYAFRRNTLRSYGTDGLRELYTLAVL